MSHLGAMAILKFYLCNSYYAGSAVHHKMKRASDCDAAWTSSVDRQRFLTFDLHHFIFSSCALRPNHHDSYWKFVIVTSSNVKMEAPPRPPKKEHLQNRKLSPSSIGKSTI